MNHAEFRLHDLTVRLVDAAPQFSCDYLEPGSPTVSPDLTVRFVDRLPGTVRHVIKGKVGYTDEDFLLLQGRPPASRAACLALDRVGHQPIEMICERGFDIRPALLPLLHLIALSRGTLTLHASAFTYQGVGVLATGWPEGGKTSALLGFTAHGAQPISDDWLHLDEQGRMHGISTRITLRDWQLDHLPAYRARLSQSQRRRLQMMRWALALERSIPRRLRERTAPGRFLDRMAARLDHKRYVEITPQRLFGGGFNTAAAPLDRVFFLVTHESPAITISPAPADEFIARLASAQDHEWLGLSALYLAYRFAFPNRANPLVERAPSLRRDLLAQRIASKPAFIVYHPHPVSPAALFEAMQPFISD